MTWTCVIDESLELVVISFEGEITDSEIFEASLSIKSNPKHRPYFNQLVDMLAVTSGEVSRMGLHRIMHMNLFGIGSRRAIVADSDLLFGMSRMFEILRQEGKEEIQVFHTLEEAELWLQEQ